MSWWSLNQVQKESKELLHSGHSILFRKLPLNPVVKMGSVKSTMMLQFKKKRNIRPPHRYWHTDFPSYALNAAECISECSSYDPDKEANHAS